VNGRADRGRCRGGPSGTSVPNAAGARVGESGSPRRGSPRWHGKPPRWSGSAVCRRGDRAGGTRRARGGRGLDALPEQRAQVRRRVGDRRGDAQVSSILPAAGCLVVADRARLG
jgi:hypothetical protein